MNTESTATNPEVNATLLALEAERQEKRKKGTRVVLKDEYVKKAERLTIDNTVLRASLLKAESKADDKSRVALWWMCIALCTAAVSAALVVAMIVKEVCK